jgi:hypothetical protein
MESVGIGGKGRDFLSFGLYFCTVERGFRQQEDFAVGRFIAQVYGTPDPKLSHNEVDKIISDAEAQGMNVFFGEGWRYREQHVPGIIYPSRPPVKAGLLDGFVASFTKLFS